MGRVKLTPEQKLRRQHERKAARLNAAERKAHGPLFEHLAPVHTVEDAERKWRLLKAAVAEQSSLTFRTSFEWIVVANIERWARLHLGEIAEELIVAARKTFACPGYVREAWHGALTGRKPMRLRLWTECRPEWAGQWNKEGRRVFESRWPEPGTPPHLSDAEFRAMFPSVHSVESVLPTEDEIEFDRISCAIGRGERQHDE